MNLPLPSPNYTVAELNNVVRKKRAIICTYKDMAVIVKLLPRSSTSTKMSFLQAIRTPVIRIRVVTPHTRLHVEPLQKHIRIHYRIHSVKLP